MHPKIILFYILVLAVVANASGQVDGPMKFTVSMDQPYTHYYHVTWQCEKVKGDVLNVKLPVWTPGYYWLVNFSKNVVNFRATDGQGNVLRWHKTAKNAWRIETNHANAVVITYDVYAFTQSVADPFLDAGRGYISPAAVFMHVEGQLQHPVTIALKPYVGWNKISTGLEPVSGQPNTFSAPDFDVLYDCPVLLGNQEVLSFEVQGIRHDVAMEEPDKFDKQKFVADLKRMVEAGAAIIGEIPYKHYTFIIMGEGRGGLEHRNSTAVFSSGTVYDPADQEGYKRWLAFLAHEYFHLYNIKAIRPIALGPFDYDKENYTNMLWVSEGFTVYYEYLILNRAGLLTYNECLDNLSAHIRSYENIPGHLFQSATESSFNTWIQFFNRSENADNTTISYYDKGAALAMLLDLKIRQETRNKKSLDDVMKMLYHTYYKEKKRGFKDEEFQQACESVAGCALPEIMEYASTVKEIDYPKYLAYGGLAIDVTPHKLPGVYLGATFQEKDGQLVITKVNWESPAWHAGLSAQDIVLELNSNKASLQELDKILSGNNSDKVNIRLKHRNIIRDTNITLANKTEKSFHITPLSNPNTLQTAILKSLLRIND